MKSFVRLWSYVAVAWGAIGFWVCAESSFWVRAALYALLASLTAIVCSVVEIKP